MASAVRASTRLDRDPVVPRDRRRDGSWPAVAIPTRSWRPSTRPARGLVLARSAAADPGARGRCPALAEVMEREVVRLPDVRRCGGVGRRGGGGLAPRGRPTPLRRLAGPGRRGGGLRPAAAAHGPDAAPHAGARPAVLARWARSALASVRPLPRRRPARRPLRPLRRAAWTGARREAHAARPRPPGRGCGWRSAGAAGPARRRVHASRRRPARRRRLGVVARTHLPPGHLIDARWRPTALAAGAGPRRPRAPRPAPRPRRGARAAHVGAGADGRAAHPGGPGGAPGTGRRRSPPGQRAVAVPLSAAGGPPGSGRAPGSTWSRPRGRGPPAAPEVVVADAEVLATPTAAARGMPGAGGEALLRVTAPQALRVTAALNFAREVRLLARPPTRRTRRDRAPERRSRAAARPRPTRPTGASARRR